MENAASTSPRRVVTSVDLGELKPQVVALSAAAGVGPSTWLRELVRREVEGGAARADTGVLAAPKAKSQSVYRAWLDADLTAELDAITRTGGFRNRTAALRAILKNVGLQGTDSSTADAVRAVGVSNHHLVAIGRNINQIAKALHAAPGKTTASERIELEEAAKAIHKHLEVASRLVGELRPMVRTKRAET